MQSQKRQNDLCLFPRQTIQYHRNIQVYAPTSNAEEAEVERFYEDLQDLLELTPKKDGSSLGNANENYFTSITRSIIKIPQNSKF